MDAKLEIKVNGETIFGLYEDDNLMIEDDPGYLATARERLSAGLAF